MTRPGARFVLWRDKVPYDAEVEYLEFTGLQRILTDIVPSVYSTLVKIDIDYQLTSLSSRQLGGSGSSYLEFCSNNGYVQADSSFPADLNRHTLEFFGYNTFANRVRYDGQSISVNGYVNSTSTSAFNAFTLGSLYKDRQSNAMKAKVFSLSMTYQNGTKLLDWIPVRVGTTGYLYDRVTGLLFGNQGSGDFVLGPDATTWEGAMMDTLTLRLYSRALTASEIAHNYMIDRRRFNLP